MTLNVTKESIEDYLLGLAGDDNRLAELLPMTLSRTLCRELAQQDRPDHLSVLKEVPDNAPDWLRTAFNEGQTLYEFAPDAPMQDRLRHIADWLKAALHNDADWLSDCDDKGRPKKLVKIGSVEQAVKEADKAMLIFSQKAAALPYNEAEGECTVMTFADGYRIVQLLTPEALDQESGFLGHCIGDGGYDEALLDGKTVFYSLRDPQGKGHATMEVDVKDHALLQCKGKQNAPPVSRYMPHIQGFLKRERFELREAPRMTGLIEVDGKYYDIHNLPQNLCFEGNLYLRGTAITQLPDGLSVWGSLYLRNTAITHLPDGLSVAGTLVLSGTAITELPDGLSVGGYLDLEGTAITHLPDGLNVGGSLYLEGTTITHLPNGLSVGGNLDLEGTAITHLPNGLSVGGDLDLEGLAITHLPNGLSVGGDLDLEGTAITHLPEDLEVKGIIYLPNGQECASVEEARQWLDSQRQDFTQAESAPSPA